jgi:hypothetical protein
MTDQKEVPRLPDEPGLYLDKEGHVWRRSALGAKHAENLETGFRDEGNSLAFQIEHGPFTLLVAGPAPFEVETQRVWDERDNKVTD